jgi:glucokinase
VKRAQEALAQNSEPSLLRKIPEGMLSSRAIDEAARAGDPMARRLMRETAHYLAVGAVCLMHTIDPDIVLFGGGMIAAGEPFLEDIRHDIRAMAFPTLAAGVRIEYAALGGDAGFIGAAGCARAAFGKPA